MLQQQLEEQHKQLLDYKDIIKEPTNNEVNLYLIFHIYYLLFVKYWNIIIFYRIEKQILIKK